MKRSLKVLIIIGVILLLLLAAYLFFFQFRPDITADIFISIGDDKLANGHPQSAVGYYEKAYRLDPDSDVLAAKAAAAYRSAGNLTKTEQYYTTAIRLNPAKPGYYLSLSALFVEEGKLADACRLLDQIENDAAKAVIDPLRPQTPTLSPESGIYSESISVSVAAQDGMSCYVSCDGFPGTAENLYAGPIALPDGDTTVCAVAVSEDGLVSPAVYGGYVLGGVSEKLTFSDKALEQYVRDMLGIGSADIYTDHLREIFELTVPAETQSLEDLCYFTSLLSLTVNNASLTDAEFLNAMPGLRVLDLAGCRFDSSVLEAVCSYSQLEYLNLSGCNLTDIRTPEKLSELKYLVMDNNSVQDLTRIAALPALEELYLSSNALTDVSALSGLRTLKYLDISGNSVTDAAPLGDCTGLVSLDISDNKITSVDTLGMLTKLNELNCSKNQISDITALSRCVKLTALNLSGNELTDLSPIKDIETLDSVNADNNKLFAVPAFTENCCLVRFSACGNYISDVTGLSRLPLLNYVYLDYNETLSDISSLLYCPNLIQVDVFDTAVTDISMFTDVNGYDSGILINFGSPDAAP